MKMKDESLNGETLEESDQTQIEQIERGNGILFM